MAVKIAFSGIGGVGGYYGGLLAGYYEKSETVKIYFISRGQNLSVIQKQGLEIKTPDSSRTVRPAIATGHAEETGIVDYLFCTTKSYDLEANLEQLQPMIGAHTILIPLLNGADITDRIRHQFPQQEVWYGCVYIGARLTAPGLITKFTERERLWFGCPHGDRDKQKELLHILTQAGISAQNPEDILYRIWRKFFLISIGATLTSYYNQSIGEILEFHREDYFCLGDELKAIARAKGITFPENIIEQIIDDQQKMPYESTTSMHTDFKNGKPTELETLTGYVVKSGMQLHIQTPIYRKMYEKLNSR